MSVVTDLSPNAVAANLAEIARQLDAGQRELARLDEEATRSRWRYERAVATALLAADGRNAEARKAQATLATEKEWLDVELCAVKVRAAKEHQRVLRDRLDVGRSLGANLRMEWQQTGSAA